MEKGKKDDRPSPSRDRQTDRDSHGTKIDRVPGPGPKDTGKGAAGKQATDRLNRKPGG
jgi:hypothetical protein